jgi:hypothetical protein
MRGGKSVQRANVLETRPRRESEFAAMFEKIEAKNRRRF